MQYTTLVILCNLTITLAVALNTSAEAQDTIRVLNFQADSGFQHDSKAEALAMVERLGRKNGWEVDTSAEPFFLNEGRFSNYDVVVFNNNCGTDKRIFSADQHRAIQSYIRSGGGFVGIHCAGAIWHEGGEFQKWYEGLIGTRLVSHPQVQEAKLIVERTQHPCTAHLPRVWTITDEWHKFSYNPREKVNVLISLDESTYEGDESNKMGGDHPFTWYQYYDGGRSFFTSLGHTKEVYKNADYQQLVEAGIVWASGKTVSDELPVKNGLVVDLNGDKGVTVQDGQKVIKWENQVTDSLARDFIPNDYGIRLAKPGSGRPTWLDSDARLGGHRAIEFVEDELVNRQDDAFDHLLTGSGYTWFAVVCPRSTADSSKQTEFGQHRLADVNAFLGNLRNEGNYEGLWGCLNDDLTFWCGSRSGKTFGRFDENNPKLVGPRLRADRYYVLAARMGSGTGTVQLDIFVNDATPKNSVSFPVSTKANPSRLAIGTERDATNHPGSESFEGSMARVFLFERPLGAAEMRDTMRYLLEEYNIAP